MRCKVCRSKITDPSGICYKCLYKRSRNDFIYTNNQNTISLTCKNCNGTMLMEERIMRCPYCGSSRLVVENDNVAIQRLKNESNYTKHVLEYNSVVEQEKTKRRSSTKNIFTTLMVVLGKLVGIAIISIVLLIVGILLFIALL